MLNGLQGTRDLSLVVATAIASIKVGGSESDCLFTTFEVKRQVSCIDFATLILGVPEQLSAPKLAVLLREMKHTLTEEHARTLVAEAVVYERTGMSDETQNFYFQQYGDRVGIGCVDLRGKEWFFDSDHFDNTAVFNPGSRVIVRSFKVPHPKHKSVLSGATVDIDDGKRVNVALLADVVLG